MEFDGGDLEEEVIAEPEDAIPPSSAFSALLFLQSNGWYILILSLILYYLWKSKISNYLEKMRQTREDEEEASKCKKDPDLYKAREEARRAAVLKLQNSYNEQAQKMKILAEEKEKKKREEFISRNSHLSAGRRLNEDYNPLSGSGGPSYRAPPRSFPFPSPGNR